MHSFKKVALSILLLLTPLSHSNIDIGRSSILNLERGVSKNVLATVICSAAFLIKSIKLLLRPANESHAKPTGNTTTHPSNTYQNKNIIDFKNRTAGQAPSTPQLSVEEQFQIMHKFELYTDQQFIERIKTFSNFKPIIIQIHRDIQNKAIIYPHKCRSFSFKKKFERTVNQLVNEAKSMPDVKTSHQPPLLPQPAQRCIVRKAQSDCITQTKNYTLSPQAMAALESAGINMHRFTECKGDNLTQDTHAKFVNTINLLAGYCPKTTEGEYIKNGTIECTQAGIQLNKEGYVHEAMYIADFCCLIAEKAIHFVDNMTPLGFIADASVSALRAAAAHDLANSIETFRANADTFRAGFIVGITQGITDIKGICDGLSGAVHALQDLIHIMDDAFLFEEALEAGRLDITQPIIERNNKRCDTIKTGIHHFAQQNAKFIEHMPDMTAQEWQQTGLATGNFIGREAAQLSIMHAGLSGLNKIGQGIALSAHNFKTITQELALSAQFSNTPATLSNVTKHVYNIENIATQNGSKFIIGIPATHPELANRTIINAGEQFLKDATQAFADTRSCIASQAAGALQLGKELGCWLIEAKPGCIDFGSSKQNNSDDYSAQNSNKNQETELRASIKKYQNQYNEKQKISCEKHGIHTVKGRHDFSEHSEEWHKVVPGNLEHEILAKPFDHTMHTHVNPALPQWMNENPKSIVINYEHITTPELKTRCSKGEVSNAGFHHDHLGKIVETGLVETRNKTMLSKDCYELEWRSHNSTWKASTMFPEHWTKAQTMEKIFESLKSLNTKEIIYECGKRYLHLGITSEGIPILSVIEVNEDIAKLITAYPDFISYNSWLQRNI